MPFPFLLLSSADARVPYSFWCSDQIPDPPPPKKLREASLILAYGLGGYVVDHIGEGMTVGAQPASDITSEVRKQTAMNVRAQLTFSS